MAKRVRWTGVGSKVGEMPRADLLKSGHWRAVCGESRKHGSEEGKERDLLPIPCDQKVYLYNVENTHQDVLFLEFKVACI